jgi:cell wall-associated NlpC family hydrolase
MTLHTRFALLALTFCIVLIFAARHASAAPNARKQSAKTALVGPKAVGFAKRFLGTRYTYGGSSPRSGFDCSGLVSFVYKHFGIALPRTSYGQFGTGRRVARRWLKPGDLIFFNGLGHVGMYVGEGRFIHSPRTGTRVRIDRLAEGWYSSRYVGARRVS